MSDIVGRILLAALMLFSSSHSMALSTDKDQPLEIEADRVEVDDNTGISTFHGNVNLTKGSIRMNADAMTVYRSEDDQDIGKVVATGNRVIYRQRPDNSDDDLIAKARRIEYYADSERVLLLRDAEVQQGQDTFTGDRIEYDMRNERVFGRSDPGSKERVKITIHPKKDDTPPGRQP